MPERCLSQRPSKGQKGQRGNPDSLSEEEGKIYALPCMNCASHGRVLYITSTVHIHSLAEAIKTLKGLTTEDVKDRGSDELTPLESNLKFS